MTMTFNKLIATAIVSGAVALGGLSVAAAPQDEASKAATDKASPTKAEGPSATERRERQVTANLNRQQLTQGPQVAQAPTTAQQPAGQPPAP